MKQYKHHSIPVSKAQLSKLLSIYNCVGPEGRKAIQSGSASTFALFCLYNSVLVQKTPDVVDKVVKHMASFPTKYDKEEINRLVKLFEMCEKQDRDLLAVIVQDHSNLMQYLDQKDLQAIQNDLSKVLPSRVEPN